MENTNNNENFNFDLKNFEGSFNQYKFNEIEQFESLDDGKKRWVMDRLNDVILRKIRTFADHEFDKYSEDIKKENSFFLKKIAKSLIHNVTARFQKGTTEKVELETILKTPAGREFIENTIRNLSNQVAELDVNIDYGNYGNGRAPIVEYVKPDFIDLTLEEGEIETGKTKKDFFENEENKKTIKDFNIALNNFVFQEKEKRNYFDSALNDKNQKTSKDARYYEEQKGQILNLLKKAFVEKLKANGNTKGEDQIESLAQAFANKELSKIEARAFMLENMVEADYDANEELKQISGEAGWLGKVKRFYKTTTGKTGRQLGQKDGSVGTTVAAFTGGFAAKLMLKKTAEYTADTVADIVAMGSIPFVSAFIAGKKAEIRSRNNERKRYQQKLEDNVRSSVEYQELTLKLRKLNGEIKDDQDAKGVLKQIEALELDYDKKIEKAKENLPQEKLDGSYDITEHNKIEIVKLTVEELIQEKKSKIQGLIDSNKLLKDRAELRIERNELTGIYNVELTNDEQKLKARKQERILDRKEENRQEKIKELMFTPAEQLQSRLEHLSDSLTKLTSKYEGLDDDSDEKEKVLKKIFAYQAQLKRRQDDVELKIKQGRVLYAKAVLDENGDLIRGQSQSGEYELAKSLAKSAVVYIHTEQFLAEDKVKPIVQEIIEENTEKRKEIRLQKAAQEVKKINRKKKITEIEYLADENQIVQKFLADMIANDKESYKKRKRLAVKKARIIAGVASLLGMAAFLEYDKYFGEATTDALPAGLLETAGDFIDDLKEAVQKKDYTSFVAIFTRKVQEESVEEIASGGTDQDTDQVTTTTVSDSTGVADSAVVDSVAADSVNQVTGLEKSDGVTAEVPKNITNTGDDIEKDETGDVDAEEEKTVRDKKETEVVDKTEKTGTGDSGNRVNEDGETSKSTNTGDKSAEDATKRSIKVEEKKPNPLDWEEYSTWERELVKKEIPIKGFKELDIIGKIEKIIENFNPEDQKIIEDILDKGTFSEMDKIKLFVVMDSYSAETPPNGNLDDAYYRTDEDFNLLHKIILADKNSEITTKEGLLAKFKEQLLEQKSSNNPVVQKEIEKQIEEELAVAKTYLGYIDRRSSDGLRSLEKIIEGFENETGDGIAINDLKNDGTPNTVPTSENITDDGAEADAVTDEEGDTDIEEKETVEDKKETTEKVADNGAEADAEKDEERGTDIEEETAEDKKETTENIADKTETVPKIKGLQEKIIGDEKLATISTESGKNGITWVLKNQIDANPELKTEVIKLMKGIAGDKNPELLKIVTDYENQTSTVSNQISAKFYLEFGKQLGYIKSDGSVEVRVNAPPINTPNSMYQMGISEDSKGNSILTVFEKHPDGKTEIHGLTNEGKLINLDNGYDSEKIVSGDSEVQTGSIEKPNEYLWQKGKAPANLNTVSDTPVGPADKIEAVMPGDSTNNKNPMIEYRILDKDGVTGKRLLIELPELSEKAKGLRALSGERLYNSNLETIKEMAKTADVEEYTDLIGLKTDPAKTISQIMKILQESVSKENAFKEIDFSKELEKAGLLDDFKFLTRPIEIKTEKGEIIKLSIPDSVIAEYMADNQSRFLAFTGGDYNRLIARQQFIAEQQYLDPKYLKKLVPLNGKITNITDAINDVPVDQASDVAKETTDVTKTEIKLTPELELQKAISEFRWNTDEKYAEKFPIDMLTEIKKIEGVSDDATDWLEAFKELDKPKKAEFLAKLHEVDIDGQKYLIDPDHVSRIAGVAENGSSGKKVTLEAYLKYLNHLRDTLGNYKGITDVSEQADDYLLTEQADKIDGDTKQEWKTKRIARLMKGVLKKGDPKTPDA